MRQGDPLSPYLFILCSKFLTRLLSVEEAKHELHGIKVCRAAPIISHLFYADDLMVMCRAISQDAKAIHWCFSKYCVWSGQDINLEKSSIIFSNNIRGKVKAAIKVVLGFKEMHKDSVYLGNNMILSRNKYKDFTALKERISNRVEGWSRHMLSKAAKHTLIKSVIQGIPSYSMATFQIPISVCNELDKLVKRYWWGTKPGSNRYCALKSWNDICIPKKWGGLSLR